MEYYRQGKEEECETILKSCSEIDMSIVSKHYQLQAKDRIQILNALAYFYIMKGQREKNGHARQGFLEKALAALNHAEVIEKRDKPLHSMTFVGKGLFHLYQETPDIPKAQSEFRNAWDVDNDNVLALLGLANCRYANGDYAKAANHYRDALRKKPDLSADVRVGLGFCYYQLKKTEAAVAAFERALQIDGGNATAIAALALLEMYGNEKTTTEGMERGLGHLTYAYGEINTTLLLHLYI